jgi:hypothetical protein
LFRNFDRHLSRWFHWNKIPAFGPIVQYGICPSLPT